MINVNVTYMSGAGNLFSVIDNRETDFSISDGKKLAPILCNKNDINEFETEGLMFLENSYSKDFECKFFNPDGSQGMMCGNGGRSITRFASLLVGLKSEYNFSMAGDNYKATINSETGNIKLFMPPPSILPELRKFNIFYKEIIGYYANTGTHHFCLDIENINNNIFDFDINKFGSGIRHLELFQPTGTNVNFYKIIENRVFLRTFEKGVEKETGACGTGAVATSLTVANLNLLNFPIEILPTSGELLIIDKIEKNGEIINMILEGPAKIIFQTNIFLDNNILN